MLVGAITLQAALGILTLLYLAPLGLALGHQALAIVVLTVAVVHAARLAQARRDTNVADVGINATGQAR
jgi:cytochrome c oxidase assembly protein subunit 15